MGYKVAVVGATGNVGREMLDILAEREFPADEVVALASRRSLGVEVSFGDRTLKVKALEHFDFSDTDICLMSAGSAVSKEWSPKIAAAGAVVIDNSSCWRYDPGRAADRARRSMPTRSRASARSGIIANPNCSTAQLVVALKPLHDRGQDQARGGGDLSVGFRRRQGRDGRTVRADQVGVSARRSRGEEVPQAHRLQPDPADRCLHGGRLHQGRVEDGGRDQEDPRPEDQAHRHLRARAGVHRPFRSGQYRVREADHAPTRRATSCATRRAASSSTSTSRAATSRRTRRRARTRPISAASARTRRSRTACRCGSSPTICARARRSTPSRSPNA